MKKLVNLFLRAVYWMLVAIGGLLLAVVAAVVYCVTLFPWLLYSSIIILANTVAVDDIYKFNTITLTEFIETCANPLK